MIDPRFMESFMSWAQQSYPDLLQRYQVSLMPSSEADWQDWGASLLSISDIAAAGAPNAYQFDDWREWVSRLIQVLGQGE